MSAVGNLDSVLTHPIIFEDVRLYVGDMVAGPKRRAWPAGTTKTVAAAGSVLPALLFRLYIYNLNIVAPNDVEIAMFADDVSLQPSLQDTVTRVAVWSKDHKVTLSTGKCEVAFFISNPHEAR